MKKLISALAMGVIIVTAAPSGAFAHIRTVVPLEHSQRLTTFDAIRDCIEAVSHFRDGRDFQMKPGSTNSEGLVQTQASVINTHAWKRAKRLCGIG